MISLNSLNFSFVKNVSPLPLGARVRSLEGSISLEKFSTTQSPLERPSQGNEERPSQVNGHSEKSKESPEQHVGDRDV
jgi:hypothetical protein